MFSSTYFQYADSNSYPCPILGFQVVQTNQADDWNYASTGLGSINLRLSSSIPYGNQSFRIAITYTTSYVDPVTNYVLYNVYCYSSQNPSNVLYYYTNYYIDLVGDQNQFVNIAAISGDVGWVFSKLAVPYHDICRLTYQVYKNENLSVKNTTLQRHSFLFDQAQLMTDGKYLVKIKLDQQINVGIYTFYLLIIAQNSQNTVKDSWWSSPRFSTLRDSTKSYTLTLIDCSSQSQYTVTQNQVIANTHSDPTQGFLIKITPPVNCSIKSISSYSTLSIGGSVLNDFSFNQQLNQYYTFPSNSSFTGELSVYLKIDYNQGGSTISEKAYKISVITQETKDYLNNKGETTLDQQNFFVSCLPLINSLNPQAPINITASESEASYYSNTDIQNKIQQVITKSNLNNASLPSLILFEEFQPKDYSKSCGTGVYSTKVTYQDTTLKSDDPQLQKLISSNTQALFQKDLIDKISQIGNLTYEALQQISQLDLNKKYNFLYLQPQLINNLSSNQFRLQLSFFKQSDSLQILRLSQKTFFYDFDIQYLVPFVINKAPFFMDADGNQVDQNQVVKFEATDNSLIPPYSLGTPIDYDNDTFSILIKEDVQEYVKLQSFSNTLIFSKLTQQLKGDLPFTVVIRDNASFPEKIEYKFLIKFKNPQLNASNNSSTSSNSQDKKSLIVQEELQTKKISDDLTGPSPKLLLSPMSSEGKILFKFTRPLQIPDQLMQLYEQDVASLALQKDSRNLLARSAFYNSKLFTGTNQSHTVYISKISSTQIEFQVMFDHPEQVSISDQSSQDILQISLTQDLLTYLVDLENGQPLDYSYFGENPVITIKIPAQIDPLLINQSSTAQTLSQSLQVVTIASFVLQYFLSFSMNFFWSMIHSLSMVVFLPLFNINLPANFQNVINFLANIAFFDIVPQIETINQAMFQFSERTLEPVRFQSVGFGLLGFASKNFIMNSGSQFLMFCIFVCSITISAFLRFLAKKSKKFQWLYKKTNFFDDPKTVFLRFLFEGNLLLMISAIIGVELIPQAINMTDNVGDLLAVVFSVIFIFLTIPFIIFVQYIITRKIKLLEQTSISESEKYYKNMEEICQLSQEEQKQFWIYVDWKIKLRRIDLDFDMFFDGIKQDQNMSLQFYYIYLLRRLILVVTIIYLENYLSLQIIANICVNLLIVAYYGYYMPFQTKLLNIIEIVNELCVLSVNLTLCFYTDWINDPNLKIKLQDISIYIIYIGSAFNLFLILIEIIKAFYTKIQQIIAMRKYSQQLQQLSKTFKIREKFFVEQSKKTGKTVQQLRNDWEMQREDFMAKHIALHLKSSDETRVEAIFDNLSKMKQNRKVNQENQVPNNNLDEELGDFNDRKDFKIFFKEQSQKIETNQDQNQNQNTQNYLRVKKLDEKQVKAILQNKLQRTIEQTNHRDSNQAAKFILAKKEELETLSPGERLKEARKEIQYNYSQQKKKRQQEVLQRLQK